MQALGRKGADDSYELLTDRQHEILQLVAEGKTNKEIANTWVGSQRNHFVTVDGS